MSLNISSRGAKSHVKSELKDAFFLGAGASINSGIPLTKQFLPYLFSEKQTDPRLMRLVRFIDQFFNVNSTKPESLPKFEQVLSLLDLALLEDHEFSSIYTRSNIGQLRSDMDYLIWRMLEQSSRKGSTRVFEKFASALDPKENILFSLNYDTLLDHALLEVFKSLDYGVRFSEIHGHHPKTRKTDLDNQTPLYIKLHGSINWLQCPNCQSFYCYQGSKELGKVFDSKAELCPHDDGYLRGIIVSPTWNKRYTSAPLSLLWIKASKHLRSVKRITFIGYSLSDVDMRVIYLLKRSLFNNPANVEIRVVDPEPSGKIFKRYERLFGSINAINTSFEEFVENYDI